MDRLIREGNPPASQLASPVPQYKRPGSTDYEAVEGQHGAPFAILKDASGNVISPATDAKLEQVKSELELVKSELQTIKTNQTSGDQKVQLSGTIVEEKVLVEAMALRDTVRRTIIFNSSQYRSMLFVIRNTLDADVSFFIRPMGSGLGHRFYYHDGTEIVRNEADISIAPYAGYSLFSLEGILPKSFPIVRGGSFSISYFAEDVPTTGTLSVWLEGVRI